ncbi:sensor histidine kinase [Paenibacillus albiflavus]|uniref:sensor histidine kinase n=1 Tax=Paenibacillus albiflavus TaxID=2545760 RepID=UPI00269ABDDE
MRTGVHNPVTKIKLKHQLILLFFVMFGPMFLLNWYGNMQTSQIMQDHVTNAYIELNKQNVMLINRDLDAIKKIVTTIILNSITQSLIPGEHDTVYDRVKQFSEMDKLLANYSLGMDGRQAVYYSMFVYDPQNYYSFVTKEPSSFKRRGMYFLSDSSKPLWFDDAITNRGRSYLKVIDKYGPFQDERSLAYIQGITNIYRGNEAIGVLVVTNMEKKIEESFQTVSLPSGEIYFTNWDNQVLASTNASIGSTIHLPANPDGEESSVGTFHVVSGGAIYVVSYDAFLGQKLIYKVPVDSILQKQNGLKGVIQFISIVYFILGLIIMLYFWRSIMHPLEKMAVFVRSYEPGNAIPRLPGKQRNDEVGELMIAINEMAKRLNLLIHDKYLMDIKQKESQLQLLYQQINPHLLYNTLESIYWKSSMEGQSETADMIKELSQIMKIGLSRGNELITLEDELTHALSYTRLQQKRYEYDFEVEWQIADEVLNNLIPKVTLQPLIENAIIHGVRHMGEDGQIRITSFRGKDEIILTIEDNGYKEVNYEAIAKLLYAEQGDSKVGYGIRNVHQRIQLHFGQRYGITYAKREAGGTVVTVLLPIVIKSE